jgi:P27 family predicted phage terminase small subunit
MQAPTRFNDIAREYYNFIINELKKIDRLQETDKFIVEGLAFNLGLIEDAQVQIMERGSVVNGIHGPKINPAVEIMNKATSKVNEAYKILALDSSMRLKIDSKEDGQQSDFLNGLISGKF